MRARSLMTSHYTWRSVTTLHDFGGVFGWPFDTFVWALTISWSRLLARVWSGPKTRISCAVNIAENSNKPPRITTQTSSPRRALVDDRSRTTDWVFLCMDLFRAGQSTNGFQFLGEKISRLVPGSTQSYPPPRLLLFCKMNAHKCQLNLMILQTNLAIGSTDVIGIMNQVHYSLTLIMSHHTFHQKEWYKQGVTYLIMSHFVDLCIMWYYQKNKKVENKNKITM